MKTKLLSLFALSPLCLFGVALMGAPKGVQKVSALDTPDMTINSDSEFADFISSVNLGSRYDGELIHLTTDVSYSITVKPTDADPWSIFAGVFDGLNHTITITVNMTGNCPSLFRNLGNGDFTNAVFKNCNLTYSVTNGATTGNVYAAPIATYNNGLIQNVHSTMNYNESDVSYVAGIVEKNQSIGVIENCSVSGSINAKAYIAGITCENLGIIRDCKNNCALSTVTGAYCGGIVAINGTSSFVKAKVINCINYANINSTGTDLGGIAGFMYSNSEMSYCSNYGNVTSTATATGCGYGGIIGRMNGSDSNTGHATKVEYCYNAGNLSTVRNTGGIVGMINSGANPTVQLIGCFTTGDTNVTTQYGGTLIGWSNSNNLSLTDTYTAGAKSGIAVLGIGGGSAKATTSSISDGVSDNFKAVVKFIREYTCSEERDDFLTAYAALSEAESTLLGQVNYYDELTQFSGKTYLAAAEYIANRVVLGGSNFSFLLNDNNGPAIVVGITIVVAISLTTALVFLRKKKER